MNQKHAFCILAHKGWHQLQLLIECLDSNETDIYLHVDKKSLHDYQKSGGVTTQRSNLYFVPSVDVYWSHTSQIDAELNLFKAVVNSKIHYSRVHLISGQDLPLRPIEELIHFFDNRPEEEFIDYFNEDLQKKCIRRLKYFHWGVKIRRKSQIFEYTRKIIVALQMLIGVNRLKNSPYQFYAGANWCSLTLESIKEIVSCYPSFEQIFTYSTSSDECYKQMILASSTRNIKIAKEGISRYIDWSEHSPSPKVLTIHDYDAIFKSGCMFARKFDENIDNNIINKVIFTITRKA